MPFQEFPKAKYHQTTGQMRTVPDKEAEARLNGDWGDKKPAAPAAEPEKCPRCEEMRGSFDQAWKGLSTEHAGLKASHEALLTEHQGALDRAQELQAKIDSLQQEHQAALERAQDLQAKLDVAQQPDTEAPKGAAKKAK